MPEAIRIGIGGPVGSGKTRLIERLLPLIHADGLRVAVITNDLVTREDAERVAASGLIEPALVVGVETGACPHTAIREDPSANLDAIARLERLHGPLDVILLESGGDNLAATFTSDLVDYWIYMIDTAAGDDIPRKRGLGMLQADLLIVNKIDLAPYVGRRSRADARRCRGGAARPPHALLRPQEPGRGRGCVRATPLRGAARPGRRRMSVHIHQDGLLDVRFARASSGRTYLADCRQRFPLRITTPHYLDDGDRGMAFLIVQNPAGAVFAGDRLELRLEAEAGARVHLRTQSATRLCQMDGGSATQEIAFTIATEAYLEYLPEQTIPQAGSRFLQRLSADVAHGATLVSAEIVAPGTPRAR